LTSKLISKKSFESIDFWYQDVKEKVQTNATFILIGNKCDLEDERIISQQEGA